MSDAALPFDLIAPAPPPPLPADYTWIIVLGVVLGLALLAIALWHWRRTRQRRHAIRALRHVRRQHAAGTLAEQEAAYAIAAALMAGLRTRRLWAPDKGDPGWRAFVERLDALRYAEIDAETTHRAGELFAEAEAWLKRRGTPC